MKKAACFQATLINIGSKKNSLFSIPKNGTNQLKNKKHIIDQDKYAKTKHEQITTKISIISLLEKLRDSI